MILDIDVRMFESELCLMKYAPNAPGSLNYTPDDRGYIGFNLSDYSWQKVAVYDAKKEEAKKSEGDSYVR